MDVREVTELQIKVKEEINVYRVGDKLREGSKWIEHLGRMSNERRLKL